MIVCKLVGEGEMISIVLEIWDNVQEAMYHLVTQIYAFFFYLTAAEITN